MSTETLIELAKHVLKNNYFQFNNRLRKQKRGTAIGTKFAPPYIVIPTKPRNPSLPKTVTCWICVTVRYDHFEITKNATLNSKRKPFLWFLVLRDSMNIFMDANSQ